MLEAARIVTVTDRAYDLLAVLPSAEIEVLAYPKGALLFRRAK